MELVRNFKHLHKRDVPQAGGKGASLGEMTNASIPVPEGFVVLSDAFEKFIEETDLNIEIDSILHSVKHDEIHTVENASEKIKALILNAKMPHDIESDIKKYFKKLNAKYVAVRSSATSEDSASAAWAGQLESYLNTTEKDLIENVKKCWASLFTPRAIFYRFEKNLHKEKISVAVVVQKMVESEISGIAFSVHPVTQDRNQLIIEAGYGLGEAIVSGQITPDSYVVEKEPRRIIDKNISNQERGLYRVENGGNEWKTVKESGSQKLSDKEILHLTDLILKIEKHYAFPVDVEWAYEKNKFYIVQSRPITTLSNPSQKEETLVEKFKKEMGNEELLVIRGKFIPLFLVTDWLKFYDETFKEKEGIYPVLSIKRNDLFAHFISLDKYLAISKKAIERYIKDPQYKEKINDRYNNIKNKIDSLYGDYSKKKPRGEQKTLEILRNSEEYLHELVALTLFIDFLDAEIVKKTYEQQGLKLHFEKIFEVSEIYDFPSFNLKNDREIVDNIKNPEYLKHVYTGYSAAPSKDEVEGKLSKIKHRELKKEIKNSTEEIYKRSKEKKKLRDLLTQDEKSVADFLSWVIELRDDRKILINKADVLLNECVKALYEIWGIEQDLSCVSYACEVLKGNEFSRKNLANVKKRQGDFVNVYYGNNTYSEKYENLEEEFEESHTLEKPRNDVKSITGKVANKGRVRGIARIIYDPRKFHSFTEGDILVTSMTRPEFVPLMKKASAIVTDEGGIACHAAIVSRELNKPCIIGTKIATQVLRDGDEIEVDANSGLIRIISQENIEGITKEKWTKNYEGKFSLFFNSLGMDLEELKKNLGISLEHALVIYKDGVATGYFMTKELDSFSKILAEKARKDNKFLKEISANLKKSSDEMRKILSETPAQLLKKDNFQRLRKAFGKFSAYSMAVKESVNALDYELIKKYGNLLEEARKYSQDIFFKISDVCGKMLSSIAQKEKYSVKEVEALLLEELEKYLANGVLPNKEELRERNKYSVIVISNGQKVYPQHIAQQIDDSLHSISEENITGTVAFPGKIKGKVRIIKKFSNKEVLQKGEVLVTGMTDPRFVPLMKNASAIITDAGGMLCHAAIVSRELKIPCIIGTRIATRVLKTGDEVEVDGEKGIVKLIKPPKKL
ncbi:MAG: hypothetical protein RL557_757 [archaeon]|jgi:phosphoenolpyruvate synthase/pyruvate phosphate dikinase